MNDEEHNALVEIIAKGVEEGSILDLRGILSKRKRDREDADLRMKVREEQRQELGRFIRAFKRGEGRDPISELGKIAAAGGSRKYERFIDIDTLLAPGWITIDIVTRVSDNSIPARSEFIATLTKRGRAVLGGIN